MEIVGENALEYKPRKRQNPKAEEYNTGDARGSEYSLKSWLTARRYGSTQPRACGFSRRTTVRNAAYETKAKPISKW